MIGRTPTLEMLSRRLVAFAVFCIGLVGYSALANADNAGPAAAARRLDLPPARIVPVSPVAPKSVAVQTLVVSAPQVGDTIPLDGGFMRVTFTQSLDQGKTLRFMAELLRNGTVLGTASNMDYPLSKDKPIESLGAIPGQYFAGTGVGTAAAGAGYTYRITVYEGTWASRKVVASAVSGVFTFSPAPPKAAWVPTGTPQITVSDPAPGATTALDGGFMRVTFKAQHFDPTQSLRFMPELLRNGVVIGTATNTDFALSKDKPIDSLGLVPGKYFAGAAAATATAGAGYTYRVTVYEGTWASHRVIASGVSGSFSFIPAPSKAPWVPTGTPLVTVSDPAAGAAIPLDSGFMRVTFTAQHFDPTRTLSVMPELLRNGVVLGPASNMGFALGKDKAIDSLGLPPGQYFPGTGVGVAAAGAGYTYRITVYEGTWGSHRVIASGASGSFTFGPPPMARKVFSNRGF